MNFHNSEPITLYRDCQAVLIPAGNEVTLPQGSIGYITLGKGPVPLPTLPDNAQDEDVEKVVWEQLKTCFDPEIPINVVDLGLIYNCELSKNDDGQRRVDIEMTLTAPGCGMGPMLIHDVRSKLELIPTIEHAQVELVFDPPWNQGMMSDAARLQTGMM